jgi:hypothetical protein
MISRDRLRGYSFTPALGVQAHVRRACRNELRILYEAPAYTKEVWAKLGAMGRLEVFETSRINPSMKDLYRVRAPGVLLEGSEQGQVLVATFIPPGKLRGRHQLERLLKEVFGER